MFTFELVDRPEWDSLRGMSETFPAFPVLLLPKSCFL